MARVLIYKLTQVLSLVRALFHNVTIVLEQVIQEELVEFFLW